jgi:hypothetical protein
LVDFKSGKLRHAAFLRSHGGIPDSEERIEHCQIVSQPMQANAVRGEFDRKRRRMRTIFGKSGCECAVNYCEYPARKMLMNDHYSLGNTSQASFNPRFSGWLGASVFCSPARGHSS